MSTEGRARLGRVGVWSVMAALSAAVGITTMVDVAAAAPASGKGRSPILVIESHTGQRPPEVAALIEKLDDELEQRGFAAKPATILRLATGLPRPGVLDQ